MKNIERLESLIETKKKRVSALERNIESQNAEIEKLNQKLKGLKDSASKAKGSGTDGGTT